MKRAKNGPQEGLLFYLSKDPKGKIPPADFAMGEAEPRARFYKAPGNVYAERGTLSFFFCLAEGKEDLSYPLITITYADGTDWDRAFLRVDYIGNARAVDAFVTDIHGERIKIRATLHPLPAPNEWTHVALTWDENIGIRIYLNGHLFGEEPRITLLASNLGLIGTHVLRMAGFVDERVSSYEFFGGLKEIRIFDRALSDANMAELSKGEALKTVPSNSRTLYDPEARSEWDRRMGWNFRYNPNPPRIYPGNVSVRQLVIKSATDAGQDVTSVLSGIPEISWPSGGETDLLPPSQPGGMRLPGKRLNDVEGKSLLIAMPGETWNHFEITGSAYGNLTLIDKNGETPYDTKVRNQERAIYELETAVKGKKLRFDTALPNGNLIDFCVCHVKTGNAPKNAKRTDTFYIDANTIAPERLSDAALYVARFTNWRYLGDERNICIGLKKPVRFSSVPAGLPIANLLIPYANKTRDGLDGVELTIPSMKLKDTVGGCFMANIKIHDPLWQARELMNFTIRLRAGEPKKIWFDLRDRILPDNRILYITFTCSAADFKSDLLQNMLVKLYFKPLKEALIEHAEDRTREVLFELAQLKSERYPDSSELTFRRLLLGCGDVLRYDPDNATVKKALHEALSIAEQHPGMRDLTVLREYREKGTLYGVPLEKNEEDDENA